MFWSYCYFYSCKQRLYLTGITDLRRRILREGEKYSRETFARKCRRQRWWRSDCECCCYGVQEKQSAWEVTLLMPLLPLVLDIFQFMYFLSVVTQQLGRYPSLSMCATWGPDVFSISSWTSHSQPHSLDFGCSQVDRDSASFLKIMTSWQRHV